MNENDGEGFLGRWSRRKQQARSNAAGAPPAGAEAESPRAGDVGRRAAGEADSGDPARDAADPDRMLTEEDFADVEFDKLDAGSDYKRFMGDNVPASIRHKALSRLWTTDPVFAGADPIHDYHGDYTDAAVAVPEGLKTAYRVGRGFLSDEDIADWDKLGKPEPVAARSETPAADQSVPPVVQPPPSQVETSAVEAAPEPVAIEDETQPTVGAPREKPVPDRSEDGGGMV